MDPTNCSLFLAMGAASSAAFISGWLLHMMVPVWLFWTVLLSSLAAAPLGLFAPWCCQREWAAARVVPTSNIFSATMLSFLIGGGLLLGDRLLNDVLGRPTLTDDFVRTLIAVFGMGMAFSLLSFLLNQSALQMSADFRRTARRLKKMSRWAPKAKLVLCDDLEATAPGECAVCLDTLSDLPIEAARKDGLLRLPCGHVFHGVCGDRWITREVSCPMCRRPIGSLSRCERICLRPNGDDSPQGMSVSPEGDDADLKECAVDLPGTSEATVVLNVGEAEATTDSFQEAHAECEASSDLGSDAVASTLPCSTIPREGVTNGGVCSGARALFGGVTPPVSMDSAV